MGDMLNSLYYRLTSEAYDLPAVLVELILVGLCVNWCASILQGTRGTRPLRGVLIILVAATLVVRVLTAQFAWERLNLLYSYVLYGLAFIALVVFQPELRRAVIRVGDVRLRRAGGPQASVIAALVKSAGYLSRNRYGALVAIQRSVDLTGWAENGTLIRAEVSANLLNTIFFPNSPLHDLGVIIRGTRVMAANCQFPSAESDEVDAALGSRHLAAVGMSYETDALVLVVSEETGVVSLADNGQLTRYLSLDDLSEELTNRLSGQTSPGPESAPRRRAFSRTWHWVRRLLVVVPLTLVIWYVADQATFVSDTCQVALELRPEETGREVVAAGAPIVFETTLRGSSRAIDRVRAAYGRKAFPVTWVVPRAYGPRPELYSIDRRERIRKLVEESRQVKDRGLSVADVGITNLAFNVYERVSVRVPVRVPRDAGPVTVVPEQVQPAEVEVNVRRDDLAGLQAQGVQVTLGELVRGLAPGEARTFTAVPLRAPSGLGGAVRITPPTVKVTLRVDARTQVVRNVVVELLVTPDVGERFVVEKSDLNEWLIDVEVQGVEAVAESPAAPEIRAFAHVTSDHVPPPGQALAEPFRTLDVIFVTPPGVSVVGSRSVQVTLVPRPGSVP